MTTSIGAEGLDRDCLLVADSARGYADEVISLCKDNNRLSSVSSKAMKYIKRNFSETTAVKILSEDIQCVSTLG